MPCGGAEVIFIGAVTADCIAVFFFFYLLAIIIIPITWNMAN